MMNTYEIMDNGHPVGDMSARSAAQALDRAHELGIPCDRAVRRRAESESRPKARWMPGFVKVYIGAIFAIVLFLLVLSAFYGCAPTPVILSTDEYPIATLDGDPRVYHYVIRYIRGDDVHQIDTNSKEEYETILAYLEGRR